MQWIGGVLFAVALLHTFSTKFFERMAHRRPDHAGVWHLLGEVEVVFGFWAMVLIVVMALLEGTGAATGYLDSRDFTEPMFVFAIMVVAGSRAVLRLARTCVVGIARYVPLRGGMAFYFVALSFVPLLGSLITEPAAMTLAAMMLSDRIFSADVSRRLKYATLGALFVNVSIGGTLTPFAEPPVLMVAAKWNWDLWHMLSQFGWRAALAVTVNALVTTLVFRRQLAELPRVMKVRGAPLPVWVSALHVLFLAAVVAFSHHAAMFMGLLLFFLGFATAYPKYQDRLILREGLLVAFFLAGLVVLGGQQQWWLVPLLRGMDVTTVYFGATLLTAVTDNAALTYLGSLVEGLSEDFKYALVAGAVTGGGLTVIANAPNPAGFAILRGHFEDGAIHPLGLLVAALPPTLMAVIAFRLL
jgi:predicted cation transporter